MKIYIISYPKIRSMVWNEEMSWQWVVSCWLMLHSTSSGFKPCGELEVLSSKPIEWQFPISTLGIFSNLHAKRIGTLGQSLERKILFKQTQRRSPEQRSKPLPTFNYTDWFTAVSLFHGIFFQKKIQLGQYNPLVYSTKPGVWSLLLP